MRPLFLAIVSAILPFNFINAQDLESSLLWKISGNGLTEESYVFGTIHAICPEELTLSTEIEAAVEKSALVVMELDMDNPSFMMEMQRLSVNEGMTNLSTMMNPNEIAVVDDFLMKNYNTEMSQVGIFKPMALLSMVILKSYNCQQTKSVEEFVLRFAAKSEREVEGLETVADQMEIFDEIPNEEQIQWIVDMIKDSVTTRENAVLFTNAYINGDIESIYTLSQETYPSMMAYEDELLTDRNVAWVPKIITYIKEQPTFFAVGAGHLGGEKGVINLLKKEGYTVTPVKLD